MARISEVQEPLCSGSLQAKGREKGGNRERLKWVPPLRCKEHAVSMQSERALAGGGLPKKVACELDFIESLGLW